jgi:hypothetical protein
LPGLAQRPVGSLTVADNSEELDAKITVEYGIVA